MLFQSIVLAEDARRTLQRGRGAGNCRPVPMKPFSIAGAASALALCISVSQAVAAEREPLVKNYSSAHPGPDSATTRTTAPSSTPAPAHATTATPAKVSKPAVQQYAAFGSVDRRAPEFDALVAPGVEMEKLADGFDWSEGPVWMRKTKEVLFSDVPQNKIYSWSEKEGLKVFLEPSGYTGRLFKFREPGSNGLTTDRGGRLLICQHGDRCISRLNDDGTFEPLIDYYAGRRFNSPNDLTLAYNGNLYFTDPPYGLEGGNQSPLKELMFNGVYLRRPSGEVVLLTSKIQFPNGIALSPDEKTLYVAQSDSKAPTITAFPINKDGTVGEGKVFFDTSTVGSNGAPDGLKVDEHGNIWTSGPGGILVISPEGKLLGVLNTGQATANCGWGGSDGRTLYITADAYLLRIRTLSRGANWTRH